MEQLQAWERLDRAALQELNAVRLKNMLAYARKAVPLYATGPWRESLAGSTAAPLQAWPLLERGTIKAHGAQLCARHRRPGTFCRNSSASTGEPLQVAWNPHGAAWGWANEYRVMHWHGIEPGVRTLLMWGSGHPLQDWVRNCKVFRTTELTPARLDEACEYLLQQRPQLCMGLPSALTALARHVRQRYPGLPQSLVRHVKLGGEQVYPFQREELTRHLGAKLFESYGCTEVGPIAAQCPAGSMHVLACNVHLEICRDGKPASPGELGDIVVTSLSNRAMPLVRCKIGDCGRVSEEPCECGRPYPVLSNLLGRAADLFLASDGTRVHGSSLVQGLRTLLAEAPLGAVCQVLFQQIDQRHWKVLVESAAGFDATVALKLSDLVRASFGAECSAEIERVTSVPREASGKFRYYRPLISTVGNGLNETRSSA